MKNDLTTPEFWETEYRTLRKTWPSRLCRKDQEILNLFHPYLEFRKGGSFIEMGCGSSYYLPYFAKTYRFSAYGVDFSKERLQCTQDIMTRRGIKGTLLCRGFDNLPAEWEQKFDVIYSGGVVEHFRDPAAVLFTFSRYLRPDGVMITTVPHLAGFWGALSGKINHEAAQGYIRMDLESLRKAHSAAGLVVLSARYFRWADYSVSNNEQLPPVIRRAGYAVHFVADPIVGIAGKLLANRIPGLYSDMMVVSCLR